ncbi:MAG: phage tail tape measure protein [Ktedonobacteraceae bacterium]
MSIVAADLQAQVSVVGATEAETSILAMDAATTAASAALADVALASVASGDYLASLGGKVFTTGVGFDGLAASSDAAAASLSTVAASTDMTSASMAGLATSEDTATASSAGLVMGIGLAIVALAGVAVKIGEVSVKAAGDFQAAMGKVQAYANLTQAQTDSLSQSILSLATAMGQSPQAMATALYPIISSGYDASQALMILTLSAKTAAASGADMAVVADVLTTSLKAMHAPASDAGQYMDYINKIVSLGKGEVSQYAAVIGKLALAAGSARIPFDEMGAALATLTTHGFPSVAQASTSLGNLFTQIGPKVDALAQHAKKLGIAFDENAFKSMSLSEKLAYLQKITGGNQGELLKLVGGSTLALKAFNALEGSTKDFTANLEAMKNSTGTTDKVFQTTFNNWNNVTARLGASMQGLMIQVGDKLLPVLTNLVGKIAPIVTSFTSWLSSGKSVSDTMKFLHDNSQIIVPVLAGLGAILAAVLVPAVWSLAAGVIAATWPFLAIGAAVAGLVAIFMHFYQTNAPFKAVIDQIVAGFKQAWSVIQANFIPVMHQVGDVIQTKVMPILKGIGAWLISTFQPVWKQLSDTFHQQLIPAWNGLIASVKPLMPVFMAVGAIIGGVIAINIGILIGMIKGLVQAFAAIISGVAIAFGGVVKIISGAAQVINGIISFIVDLVTGHFDKLGADLGTIWKGISTMIGGVWDVISGLFRAAIGAIIGFIGGFISGIIGFFQHLWSTLVGHSIVPDMINSIISWFQQLPGRAIAAVQDLTGKIVSFFTDLAAKALAGGQSIIQGVINGIQNMMGNLGQKMQDVTKFIGSFLPHSPAERGELSHLNEYGPSLVNAFAKGITDSTPVLHAAMTHLVKPASLLGVAPAGIGPILPPSISTSVAAPQVVVNPPPIYLDGRLLASALMPYIASQIRYSTGVKF